MFSKTKLKGILLAAFVAMLALGVAGCGDDEADTAAQSAQTEAAMQEEKAMKAEAAMKEADAMKKGVEVGGAMMKPSRDIVANAAKAKTVSTLVAAVKAAGLVETLQGDGPFTVFAPTNAAFEKLPEGTLDDLLKPENKDQLGDILTYHVVAGKLKAADLKDGDTLTTVQGETLTVQNDGTTVTIVGAGSEAKVEIADVISSNGVTHVIDNVLLPKS